MPQIHVRAESPLVCDEDRDRFADLLVVNNGDAGVMRAGAIVREIRMDGVTLFGCCNEDLALEICLSHDVHLVAVIFEDVCLTQLDRKSVV